MHRFLGCSAIVALAATSSLFLSETAAAADSLPRYKLEVGQELQYSGHDEFKYEGGKFLTESTVRIWIVKQNDDGSWRVVLRQSTDFRQEQAKGTGSKQETIRFGWCDVSPDGRVKDNETIGYHFSPMNFLPALPANQSELDRGWISFEPKQNLTYRNRLAQDRSSGDRVMIESL